MPHLRFRGLKQNTVKEMSAKVNELAKLIKTEPSSFTFEYINTQFFDQNQPAEGYPFVEVLWFKREAFIKQSVAEYLTDEIKKNENHEYVTIIFQDLTPENYFENAKHF